MNIAPYVDCEFGDEEALDQFKWVHLLSHGSVNDFIESQGLPVTDYQMDNMENLPDWMFQHYQMHVQEARLLGLTAPQDLQLYDLKNESEFLDWMSIHGQEHDRLFLVVGY